MTDYPDFPIHNAKKYARMGKIFTKLSTPFIFYALLLKKRQLSAEKNVRARALRNPGFPLQTYTNKYDKNYPDAVFAALCGLPLGTDSRCDQRLCAYGR